MSWLASNPAAVSVSRTRPLSMTTPWVATPSPNWTFCSTSTVMPDAPIAAMDSATCVRERGSRPSEGSSSRTTRGSTMSARANSTIRRCPPDRFLAGSSARAAMIGTSMASSPSLRCSTFRSCRQPLSTVEPLGHALVAARPDRLPWGSDWPHLPDGRRDTGELLNLLRDWAPDEEDRRKILVDGADRLFFGS
jgi:amidohydrolase family protein